MTIDFNCPDYSDNGFVGFPLGMNLTPCPITLKIGCQDRSCELHYMDAPFDLDKCITPDSPDWPEWLSKDPVW